jgi:hypothetical protein
LMVLSESCCSVENDEWQCNGIICILGSYAFMKIFNNSQFSEAELCHVGINAFFRGIDGGLMVVLSVEASACFCKIVSTKETTNFHRFCS